MGVKINLLNHKKAQVTIFIIVAVIIVALIALFFLIRTDVIPIINHGPDENPESFLESCIKDKIRETANKIAIQGGYIQNKFNITFKFEEEGQFQDISYLCYNQNYYLPCINQEPMFIQHLKKEIENEIENDVEGCFSDLASSLEKDGYVVDVDYKGFKVELMPKKVILDIDGEMTLTKTDETRKEKDFRVSINTRFYDLAVVVQEIVNQEARFCNFDQLGFMFFYPKFDIEQFITSDSIIIYTVKHRDTQERFRFAIRGCVIPPGF